MRGDKGGHRRALAPRRSAGAWALVSAFVGAVPGGTLSAGTLPAAIAVPSVLLWPGIALADGASVASRAQQELASVEQEMSTVNRAVMFARFGELTPEQRLANGELLYRSRDYQRAAIVLSEIIEKFPGSMAALEATYLRGETYYGMGDNLAARRDFRTVIAMGNEPRGGHLVPRALARLVDVGIRLEDPATLDEALGKMAQLSYANHPQVVYGRGKALYAKGDLSGAGTAFQAVPGGTEQTHQARYFLGVIALKQARPPGGVPAGTRPNYKPAVDAFRVVTDLPPDTPEHRHVIDLAWLALGRLFYEMEQYKVAVEAYSRIGRDSPTFDTMLYELAWVYVRLGDPVRAERALEVLAVANPDSQFVADGSLLRADLLLRAGSYDKALKLYDGVRLKYAPYRDKVEAFLETNKDVGVLYDVLTSQELESLGDSSPLPPIAFQWARQTESGARAFALLDGVRESRTLLNKSNKLAERLSRVVEGSTRAQLFPNLMNGQRRAVTLLNRIALVRLGIARELDGVEAEALSGEIAGLRMRRHQIMGNLTQLPTTDEDLDNRDASGRTQWDRLSQALSDGRRDIELLEQMVKGLRRALEEPPANGKPRPPETVARLRAEIDNNERTLQLYRERVAVLKEQVENGRIQTGFGDARYQDDAARRMEFRDVLEREMQLASQGQAGDRAADYAKAVQGALVQARNVEDRIIAAFNELESQLSSKGAEVKAIVAEEMQKLKGYAAELDALDKDARQAAGLVAQRNLIIVRDKLRNLVLRADVGVTEQAWEVREEQMYRVRQLQTTRARQEQLLDDEMREVVEDGTEGAGAAGTGAAPGAAQPSGAAR